MPTDNYQMIMQLCLFIIYYQQQRWVWEQKAFELLFGSLHLWQMRCKIDLFRMFLFSSSLFVLDWSALWEKMSFVCGKECCLHNSFRKESKQFSRNYMRIVLFFFDYLLINSNCLFNMINVFYCLMSFNLRILLLKLLQN